MFRAASVQVRALWETHLPLPLAQPNSASKLANMNAKKGTRGDGVDIVVTSEGASSRPRSFDKLRPEAQEVILLLEGARRHREAIEEMIAETVPDARDLGVSWFQIGVSLGTTGEAARRRYGFGQDES